MESPLEKVTITVSFDIVIGGGQKTHNHFTRNPRELGYHPIISPFIGACCHSTWKINLTSACLLPSGEFKSRNSKSSFGQGLSMTIWAAFRK